MRIFLVLAFTLAAVACQKESKLDHIAATPGSAGSGSAGRAMPPPPPGDDDKAEKLDSTDILARTDTAKEVYVKHVLIGWKDLPAARDPKAQNMDNAAAAKLAKDVLAQLKAKPEAIDDLIKQYGEDPGMASGNAYDVKSDTPFVPEFKNLALRLKVNEAGIVKTQFGYHVIERVPPPPPDPLESAEILGRPAGTEHVFVNHMLIGWKDTPQHLQEPKALTRTKADADKLAKEALDKLNAKEDVQKVIKDYSEEPGAKDKPQMAAEIGSDTPILDEFKNLALRLKEGEAGMIKTPFGWLLMMRVAPPPPDPLESQDILKRTETSPKVKVKHILLGWAEVHGDKDDAGKKRSRADLEKLVKDTVAKLKGGAKIEPLMKTLSADPGSAKDGTGYDVDPTSEFVTPFKNLALRLKPNEIGVVKTEYGIHIIQRVE
jgi:parvulin-like peptidyl-prolyl isomerase